MLGHMGLQGQGPVLQNRLKQEQELNGLRNELRDARQENQQQIVRGLERKIESIEQDMHLGLLPADEPDACDARNAIEVRQRVRQ